LCLGPGPPSLLCMTRANLKSPYAGGTEYLLKKHEQKQFSVYFDTKWNKLISLIILHNH
jgi:hypothetical protein